MKRLISLFLLLVLLTALPLSLAACGEKQPSPRDVPTYDTPAPDGVKHTVVIEVKKYGTITVELYEKYAPITVANFLKLAGEGFYDGLTFHRVISGFMVQGGDPKGDGTGGSDTDIKGEYDLNGIYNPLSHERGVISMARGGSKYESILTSYGCDIESFEDNASVMKLLSDSNVTPAEFREMLSQSLDSASSQFFIVHEDSASLDGNYAAFGRVLSGMDVVDAIAAVSTDDNDKPLSSVVIKSIRVLN